MIHCTGMEEVVCKYFFFSSYEYSHVLLRTYGRTERDYGEIGEIIEKKKSSWLSQQTGSISTTSILVKQHRELA